MNYQTVETDILNRLAALTSIAKMVLPENQADHRNDDQITVAYKKSTFGDSVSAFSIAQEETAQFKIIIQCRKLRGSSGIYTYMKDVRRWLLGYTPTDCFSKLIMVDAGFVDDADGQWTYVLTMSCMGMAIETEDEVTYEDSKRIAMKDELGTEQIVVESEIPEIPE